MMLSTTRLLDLLARDFYVGVQIQIETLTFSNLMPRPKTTPSHE